MRHSTCEYDHLARASEADKGRMPSRNPGRRGSPPRGGAAPACPLSFGLALTYAEGFTRETAMESVFDPIETCIDAIRRGEVVIVVDDDDRENEGDFVCAAELVTAEKVNFMLTHGRGLLCAPVTGERALQLRLPRMVERSGDRYGTAFTVSVDAAEGITTGISAQDRARTISLLSTACPSPDDLVTPGHVCPLVAREGGCLRRAGHTEAAVDLARLAGLDPSGVICEILSRDGSSAKLAELRALADGHELSICAIADLIGFRRSRERLVVCEETAHLPTVYGTFALKLYRSLLDDQYHVALLMGDVAGRKNVLVRVHSECLTGDVFGSLRCDCGSQLDRALERVAEEGCGAILYMRQEGRGIGLPNKIRAYALQDGGLDTVEANEHLGFRADLRDYGLGAQILVDLGLTTIRLLTNNPKKVVGLQGYGLEIVDRVPIIVETTEHNRRYIETKRKKLGHLI